MRRITPTRWSASFAPTARLLGAALLGAASIAGCEGEAARPSSAPAMVAPLAPEPSVSASAIAAASGGGALDAPDAPDASLDGGAGPARSFDCGGQGQPRCPMQAWMKTVMAKAMSSQSAPQLADALRHVAARVPPGFDAWAEMANAGVASASAGDLPGVKASCKRCHEAYKQRYKATMRDRAF